ncbi:MAG: lysozyme inhibitor LprI family protein [Chitinophagales bacterium]|nr:lysozyme inhibitor LprI family protein [Chitinophagales bacterium]
MKTILEPNCSKFGFFYSAQAIWRIALLVCAICCSSNVFPQSGKHPIEIQLEACLDSSESTAGMCECECVAAQAWDLELNKYYKLLMGVLSPEAKELLRQSQRNWLAYRDAEQKFSSQFYTDMEGTMWRAVNAGRYREIVKKRAEELRSYYEDMEPK